jgi:ABC-2 type transport system ATP-binding protein
MTEPLIEATDLRFAYGDREVLTDIDLQVNAGEIFGLVGADGAGKTTLLHLMVGQLPLADGRLSVLGLPPTDTRLRQQLAYMPQGFGLYLDLSVQENLNFFADLHGLQKTDAAERSRDLLQRTGLDGFESRRAGQLSGGMMQKLALACALMSRPRVMFLDEPTTGVDPVSRRAFWQLLDGVRAEGMAILYTTANMDEAERCDRVGLLQDGRLERQGPPAILANADALLLGVEGPDARRLRQEIRTLPGVSLVFPVGRQLKVWLNPGHSQNEFDTSMHQLTSQLSSRILTPTLNDVALRNLSVTNALNNNEMHTIST